MNERYAYEMIIKEIQEDIKVMNRWNFIFLLIDIILAVISVYLQDVPLTGCSAIIGLMLTQSFNSVNKREEMLYELKLKSLIDSD